ncbi:MAG: hypothetical protein AAFV07_15475 [Bacteroidota bacterium]
MHHSSDSELTGLSISLQWLHPHPVPHALLDAEGKLLWHNSAWEQVFQPYSVPHTTGSLWPTTLSNETVWLDKWRHSLQSRSAFDWTSSLKQNGGRTPVRFQG